MTDSYSTLIREIASIVEQGRKTAVKYVNTALVSTYWLIGRRIVEYEQKGKKRAEYGKALLEKLAVDLTKKFVRGFGYVNLNLMRQFYATYHMQQILQTVSEEFHPAIIESKFTKIQTPSEFSEILMKRFALSWSHYCLLMRLDEPFKRKFYESECISGNWSVRQLDRQIQSMLYERTALSKRKQSVIAKAHEKPITIKPEDEIKDPYILEFLGLKDEYSESQLEEALIYHLERFLLELGNGFTFIARQKRINLEGSFYRLDLLLFHRALKCLVAIDLKIGEFTHADAGQMNLYINYLSDKEKLPGENEPIGIILCTDKKKTVVEYALGGMANRIFASKYKLQLPDTELLKHEIESEKQRLLEKQIIRDK